MKKILLLLLAAFLSETNAKVNAQCNVQPTITITSGFAVYCEGQPNPTLDAGRGWTSYYWSNGATTESISWTSGIATCQVTDNDPNDIICLASITITETPAFNVPITESGPTTYCS